MKHLSPQISTSLYMFGKQSFQDLSCVAQQLPVQSLAKSAGHCDFFFFRIVSACLAAIVCASTLHAADYFVYIF